MTFLLLCIVVYVLSVIAYNLAGPSYENIAVSGMVVSGIGGFVAVLLMSLPKKTPGLPTLLDDLSHLNPLRASNYTPAGGKRRRHHR